MKITFGGAFVRIQCHIPTTYYTSEQIHQCCPSLRFSLFPFPPERSIAYLLVPFVQWVDGSPLHSMPVHAMPFHSIPNERRSRPCSSSVSALHMHLHGWHRLISVSPFYLFIHLFGTPPALPFSSPTNCTQSHLTQHISTAKDSKSNCMSIHPLSNSTQHNTTHNNAMHYNTLLAIPALLTRCGESPEISPGPSRPPRPTPRRPPTRRPP